MENEKRLTRLEENACFQENSLEKLNRQLVEQQKQLDLLQHEIRKLREIAIQFKELCQSIGERNPHAPETPPHYQPDMDDYKNS